MYSGQNLASFEQQGYEYILGVPLRKLTEVRDKVLATPGRYRSLAENLRIKQVTLDGRRYILVNLRRMTVLFISQSDGGNSLNQMPQE